MGSNSSAVRFVLFSKLFREVLSSVKYSISLSSLTDSPRDSLYVEGEIVAKSLVFKISYSNPGLLWYRRCRTGTGRTEFMAQYYVLACC